LSYEKKKKPELVAELMELKSEIQRLQTEITFMQTSRQDLENERKSLAEKVDTKEMKIEELFQDKETLLKEKSVILESKTDILEQVKDKELLIQQKDQKIVELREKFKKSSSELLIKSMQIDKLMKKGKEDVEVLGLEKVKEFEEKIKELEKELENAFHEQKEEIEKSTEGSTRIIPNMEDIVKLLKKVLPQAKSTIRLVMPNIQDLSNYDLVNLIKEIPDKVRLNIAAEISDPERNIIVSDLRNSCQLTNYLEKKIIAFNIDSSKCLIGVFSGDKVTSIYSEILEIIEMLNPAIMEPFVRGRRV
jgi:chromosome segregation ATPase